MSIEVIEVRRGGLNGLTEYISLHVVSCLIPAINILAIVYTANLLGYEMGVARAVGAISFAVVIGLIMGFIFRKEEGQKIQGQAFTPVADDSAGRKPWQYGIFFGSLLGILITAAGKNWIPFAILCVVLGFSMWRWFTIDELKYWLKEIAFFLKKIIPWLLIGVFIAGILGVVIPPEGKARLMGGNTLLGNFIASIGGALMYIATLTEVPVIKTFMDLGMGKGPALALLVAGSSLSLPCMLALRGIMGTKKC